MSRPWLLGLLDGLSPDRQQHLRQRLNRLLRPAWLGTLRRTTPLSQNWGFDRGVPVDRYYIERFLGEHRTDIRGRVLEVKDGDYTRRFGSGVEDCEVLDLDPKNPQATIVADLTALDSTITAGSFDCFILTQTLQFIYDVHAAVAGSHRLLGPGGVLLATVPAVSRAPAQHERIIDYWRFTTASVSALFGDVFGVGRVEVSSYGNVLAAIAFLAGMAADELSPNELDTNDPDIPVLIAVRAVKS
jgi:hypothetical protein